MLPVLEEFGVTVLEQPLPAGPDRRASPRSSRRATIPVIADESCLTAADIPPLVGAVDGINIKLAKCGSLREALRMIAVARAHDMMVMVGCMIESSLAHHRGGALHAAGGHRRSRRCGAARQRSVRRRHHRRRPGHAARRPGARRPGEMTERFAQVALPLPLASSYTYRIPETLGDRVVPGARVVVPVRRRELIGIVVAARQRSRPTPRRATCSPRRTRSPRSRPALLETARLDRGLLRRARSVSRSRRMLPAGCGASRRWSATLVRGAAVARRTRRRGARLAGGTGRGGAGRDGGARAQAPALGRARPAGAGGRGGAPGRAARHRGRDAAPSAWPVLAADPPTLLERDAPLPARAQTAPAVRGAGAARRRAPLVRHVIGQLGFSAGRAPGARAAGSRPHRARPSACATRSRTSRRSPPPRRSTADQQAALAAIEAARIRATARCSSASPAAARRWCTSRRCAGRWPQGGAPSCWCPRSGSRRRR